MLDLDRSDELMLAKSEAVSVSPESETSLTQMDVESLWHPMVQHKKYERNPPKRMDKAEGCYVTDSEGKEYLNGVSGLWCVNVGYGRQELADAAHEQLIELSYFPLIMSHSPAIKLAAKLIKLLGFEGKVHFSNSGSEANETAFKVVLVVWAKCLDMNFRESNPI